MRKILVAFLLLGMVGSVLADGIDDAEAARRGVPVSMVQLENAKARISDLEKKLADAQKKISDLSAANTDLEKKSAVTASELASLKSSMTPAQTDGVAEIKKAISEHRLCNGMTLDEADKSLGVKGFLDSQGSDGSKSYTWRIIVSAPPTKPGTVQNMESYTYSFSGDLLNGKIIAWVKNKVEIISHPPLVAHNMN